MTTNLQRPLARTLLALLCAATAFAFVPVKSSSGWLQRAIVPSPLGSSTILQMSTMENPSKKSSAVASSDDKASSLPPRTPKHKNRRKKTTARQPKRQRPRDNIPLSKHDVGHHVAHEYLNKLRHPPTPPSQRLHRRPSLVLNADYQPMSYLPLSVWNWQEAVKAVFNGKVTVVDVYPDVMIRAANLEIPLPSVIALNEYVPKFKQRPAFTRRNVFLRDEYRCQYCMDFFHTRDLSLDHVVPRSRGGGLNWENAVTCCLKCNGRKGSLDVSQLRSVGMKLVREPSCPNQYELAAVAGRMLPRRVHPTWTPYLGGVPQQEEAAKHGQDFYVDAEEEEEH